MEEMVEKKPGFFKRLGASKKKQIVFFVVSMVIIFATYFSSMRSLKQRFDIIQDNFSWMYQIDAIKEQNGELVLSGWAFRLGQNATEEAYEVILYDTTTGKGYYPTMSYSEREDVNTYFQCEYDYRHSGFKASIPVKKLALKEHTYQILLKPSGERNAYASDIYYCNGEVMYVDPNGFEPLEVKGTDIEHIVENGIIRVYRPDYGMYVYQYKGELYWIAEPDYGFVDGDTYVQYQMNTTQVERLPQDRLDNGWYWSNIGFMFSANEIENWNAGKYRVAKCSIPTEYSITDIHTGNHIDDWIWVEYFRPWYEFK